MHNFRTFRVSLHREKRKPIPPTGQRDYRQADYAVGASIHSEVNDGGQYCLGFDGASVDRRLGEEVLKVISPLGAEASLKERALTCLQADQTLREVLGEVLIDLFCAVKRGESALRNARPEPRQNWDLVYLPEQA